MSVKASVDPELTTGVPRQIAGKGAAQLLAVSQGKRYGDKREYYDERHN